MPHPLPPARASLEHPVFCSRCACLARYADKVRSGQWLGITGKPLTNVVAIGIGGSALGPAFVHTALATDPGAAEAAK